MRIEDLLQQRRARTRKTKQVRSPHRRQLARGVCPAAPMVRCDRVGDSLQMAQDAVRFLLRPGFVRQQQLLARAHGFHGFVVGSRPIQPLRELGPGLRAHPRMRRLLPGDASQLPLRCLLLALAFQETGFHQLRLDESGFGGKQVMDECAGFFQSMPPFEQHGQFQRRIRDLARQA
jgi:hypothetical protein